MKNLKFYIIQDIKTFIISAGKKGNSLNIREWNIKIGIITEKVIKHCYPSEKILIKNTTYELPLYALKKIAENCDIIVDKRRKVFRNGRDKYRIGMSPKEEFRFSALRRRQLNNFNERSICETEGAFKDIIPLSKLDESVKEFIQINKGNPALDQILAAIYDKMFETINFQLSYSPDIPDNTVSLEGTIDLDQVNT